MVKPLAARHESIRITFSGIMTIWK